MERWRYDLAGVEIRIEHCTVCWGYRDRAFLLAEALRRRYGARVEVVNGTLGQFDVREDGKLIWSRGSNLAARVKPPRLPDVSDVVLAIERQKAAPEDEAIASGRSRHGFGPEDAKRFYDWFGRWQDAQVYETHALAHLIAQSDFEHASALVEWGCGTGRFAERLFKKHLTENANYVGIDVSTTMVQIAARRLASWRGRAIVQQVDGTSKLPYGDHVFDRFIATYVLDLLSQSAINHVLSEAHRLLRANGKLCIISLTEGITPVSRTLSSIWKRIYALDPCLVGGCRPLQLPMLLDGAAWTMEHREVVCSWGLCSEIVIASAA